MKTLYLRSPVYLPNKVYTQVLQKSVDIYSGCPGLLAIYNYGSISVPGISDLDLLLIFEEDTPVLKKVWYENFNETERYIILHSPVAVSTSIFKSACNLALFNNLELVWGKSIEIIEPDHRTKDFICPLVAAEHCIRLLVTIMRQIEFDIIKQRPTLCNLSSIQYDIPANSPETTRWQKSFIEPILTLKKTWFEQNEPTRQRLLKEYLEIAYHLEIELLTYYSDWSYQFHQGYPKTHDRARSTVWRGVTLHPSEDGNARVSTSSQIFFPGLHLLHLTSSARLRSLISRTFSARIYLKSNLVELLAGEAEGFNPEYQHIQSERRSLILKSRQFLRQVMGGFAGLYISSIR